MAREPAFVSKINAFKVTEKSIVKAARAAEPLAVVLSWLLRASFAGLLLEGDAAAD
jgi:hypothetical protein